MKNVNKSFKENIKKYGRQIDALITFENTIIGKENINNITLWFKTSLFKTVMNVLEIDSNIEIKKGTKLDAKIGVKFEDSSYEYIECKDYSVFSCERQEDTESYKIVAYDKIIESMVDYDLSIIYPITVRNYLIAIFNKLGWSIEGIPETFINYNKEIKIDTHSEINYTYRDVLDELATITGSFIYIKNEIPTLTYITDTEETIDEEYLSQDDVTISEKYFINSLVFGRAEESDNIYRKDDTSIAKNGLHEFRISDNQILSTNDRVDFIDELFNYLKTIEFYLFDIKSTGIMYFEAADRFNITVHGNTYKTVLLNNEITVDQDIEEHLYSDVSEETETDYKSADTTDRRINQTYILVNKQEQKITQQANRISEYENKLTQVEQDVDSISQKVSNIADITRTVSQLNEVHITEAMPVETGIFKIYGNTSYFKYLYPSEDLYPLETRYPMGDGFTICVNKQSRNNPSEELKEYYVELEEPLRNIDDVCDEFVVSNVDSIPKIIRRIGVNTDGTLYVLENEKEEILNELHLMLLEGDNYLYVKEFNNLKYEIEYAILNSFTKEFATKAEVNTQIKQTSQSIDLNVNKKLEDYSTTREMNAKIELTAEEINSKVSKKVGEDEIISKINQSAEAVGINANKIELSANDVLNLLSGNAINLTSKNIVITSNAFNVDKNGNVTLKASGTRVFKVENTSNSSKRVYITDEAVVVDSATNYDRASIGLIGNDDGYVSVTSSSNSNTEILGTGIITPKLTQTSLESVKKNIKLADIDAINLIKQSDIYTYNLKFEEDGKKKLFGFVIGEKYRTPLEVISDDKQGIDTYSMSSIMWKALQELLVKTEKIEKELKEKNEKNEL